MNIIIITLLSKKIAPFTAGYNLSVFIAHE